ncbi:MAG: putative Ig domain-containing protein, partial [Planctomycetes bacterium]|nr:putative Ig domain-containing protein [Planctomycetota bacterium]
MESFQVTVSAANVPPVITSAPPGPATVGLPYQYLVRAQDADGDSVHFRLGEPVVPGMMINADTGVLNWTPTAGQVDVHPVIVIADDGQPGGETRQEFDLTVAATSSNFLPVVTFEPRSTAVVGLPYTAMVAASDRDGDPLTFTLVTKPDGMMINTAGLITWTPTAAQLGPQSAQLNVSDARGGDVLLDFSVEVVAEAVNRAPIIVSTPKLRAVADQPYALDLQGLDEDGDPFAWSLVTGPRGISLDPLTGRVRWTPDHDQLGLNPVVVQIQDALGASARQSFAIDVSCVNLVPAITSVPPTTAAVGQAYFYPVRATDSEGDPLTFTLLSGGRGNMNLEAATGLLRWTPVAGDAGVNLQVAIQVGDGQGNLATQSFVVVVSATVPNQPPVITSTPVFVATVGSLYVYDVIAQDPEQGVLTYSLETVPDGMTIDEETGAIRWTPTAATSEVVTVEVRDPAGALATQTFTVLAQTNLPPVIISTAPSTVSAGASYRYDVRATDPNGDPLSFTLIAAPGGMTIDGLGRIRWSVPANQPVGDIPVAVQVADPRGLSASQAFQITVLPDTTDPTVRLAASATLVDDAGRLVVDLNATVLLQVQASDNVGIAARGLTVGGIALALDASGSASLVLTQPGVIQAVATATDAAGNMGTATVTLRVRDPNDADAPFVEITSPDQAQTDNVVTYLTDVIGSVQDDNLLVWHLDYALVSQVDLNNLSAPDADWVELARGTTSVTDSQLAVFDPTLLRNDQYVLRLYAEDAGGLINTRGVLVSVQGEAKLGNFRLEFTDLTVPLSGIPITVTRVYDTLQAGEEGDFGYGWSLGLYDGDIRETVPDNGGDFFSQFPFKDGTRVYITDPEGKRIGFTFQPDLIGSFFGVLARPRFVPDRGVYSQLADPDVTGFALTRRSDGTYGGFVGIGNYNPSNYVLTTADGTKYLYSQSAGLRQVADLNANTLTITADAIEHSSGERIDLRRDGRGRITQIVVEPGTADESSLTYGYNAAGDLVAFTEQVDLTTTFTYVAGHPHLLDEVHDPLGRRASKTFYGPDGRVEKVIDALGNEVLQNFVPSNFTGTITDASGNVTLLVYNARGNIVEQQDPEGGITLYKYTDPRHPDKETEVTKLLEG